MLTVERPEFSEFSRVKNLYRVSRTPLNPSPRDQISRTERAPKTRAFFIDAGFGASKARSVTLEPGKKSQRS